MSVHYVVGVHADQGVAVNLLLCVTLMYVAGVVVLYTYRA